MAINIHRSRATASVAPSPTMLQPELDSIAGAVAALGTEIESKHIQAIAEERTAAISAAILENPEADIAGMLSAPLPLSDASSKIAQEQIAGATQWAASAKLGSMTARGLIAMSSAETPEDLEAAREEMMSSVQGEVGALPPEMRQRLGQQIGRIWGQVSGEYHKSLEDIGRIQTQKSLEKLVQSDDDSFQASALIGDWKGILQLPDNFRENIESSNILSDSQKTEAKRKYLLMNQKRIRDNLGMFVKKMAEGREPWGKIIDNMRTFLSAGGAGNKEDQDAWIMDNVMPLRRGQEAEDIATLHTDAFASIHTDREATKDDRRELFAKIHNAAKKHADEMGYESGPFAELAADTALKQINGFEFRKAGDVDKDIENARIDNETAEALQIIGGQFSDVVENHMLGRTPQILPPLPSSVKKLPQKNRTRIAEAIGEMNGRLIALFGEEVIVDDELIESLVKHKVEAPGMTRAVQRGALQAAKDHSQDIAAAKNILMNYFGGFGMSEQLAAVVGARKSENNDGRFLQLDVDDEYIIRVKATEQTEQTADQMTKSGIATARFVRQQGDAGMQRIYRRAVLRFPPAFQAAFNSEYNGSNPEKIEDNSARSIIGAGYRADRNPTARLEAAAAENAMSESDILDIVAPVKTFIGTAEFLPDSGDGLKKALIGDVVDGVIKTRAEKGETALYVWGEKKELLTTEEVVGRLVEARFYTSRLEEASFNQLEWRADGLSNEILQRGRSGEMIMRSQNPGWFKDIQEFHHLVLPDKILLLPILNKKAGGGYAGDEDGNIFAFNPLENPL